MKRIEKWGKQVLACDIAGRWLTDLQVSWYGNGLWWGTDFRGTLWLVNTMTGEAHPEENFVLVDGGAAPVDAFRENVRIRLMENFMLAAVNT